MRRSASSSNQRRELSYLLNPLLRMSGADTAHGVSNPAIHSVIRTMFGRDVDFVTMDSGTLRRIRSAMCDVQY